MTDFASIPWKYQSVGPYTVWRFTDELRIDERLDYVTAMARWSEPIGFPSMRLVFDGNDKVILGESNRPIYQLGMTEEVALWRAEILGPDAPLSWVPGFMKYANGQED